jgi:hypothetical protein
MNGWKTLAMKIRTKLRSLLEERTSPRYDGLFVVESSCPKYWVQTQSLSGRHYREHLIRIQTLLTAPSEIYKQQQHQSVKVSDIQFNSPSNSTPTSPIPPQ